MTDQNTSLEAQNPKIALLEEDLNRLPDKIKQLIINQAVEIAALQAPASNAGDDIGENFALRLRCALGKFLNKQKYKTPEDAMKGLVDTLLLYIGQEGRYYQHAGRLFDKTQKQHLFIDGKHKEVSGEEYYAMTHPAPPKDLREVAPDPLAGTPDGLMAPERRAK